MGIKMDYLDVLFERVNNQLQQSLDSIIEMKEAEGSNVAYVHIYIRMSVHQIYYYYNLTEDVYVDSRAILKKRHIHSYEKMSGLLKRIDEEIRESGFADDIFDAKMKTDKR